MLPVGGRSDLRKLQRDFPVVDSQRLIDQCVDLGVWCNEVCNTRGRWSMADLVIYLVRGSFTRILLDLRIR